MPTVDSRRYAYCRKSVDNGNACRLVPVFVIERTKPLRRFTTSSRIRMAMRNDEIRAKILRIFYDFEMTHPGEYMNPGYLPQQLAGISQNLIDTNLLYLCDSGLLHGEAYTIGSTTPGMVKITPIGIDVVERPDLANQYSINLQVLQVGTVYGQVAQASQGATITQTQTMTFDDLRKIVRDREDIDTAEKETIKKTLDELETGAQQGTLTKKTVDAARNGLAKYGWLLPSLIAVLKACFGF
jgi:hypothetical protein